MLPVVIHAQCVGTFDGHDEKVWALAVRRGRDGGLDTQSVTGSADSVLCVWRDVTAEEAEASIEASEARLLKQQELFNAMASRNYRRVRRLSPQRYTHSPAARTLTPIHIAPTLVLARTGHCTVSRVGATLQAPWNSGAAAVGRAAADWA